MSIDKSQATEALADIDRDQTRGWTRFNYGRSAPYIFVLGAMWFIADLLIQFGSFNSRYIWPVTGVLGGCACSAVGVWQSRSSDAKRYWQRFSRIFGVQIFIFLFVVGSLCAFYPFSGEQSSSFIGMVFGTIYAALGLWLGWRLAVIGIALAVLSLFGYFEVHHYYAAYMGVVGGGGLMLSAFWLRKT